MLVWKHTFITEIQVVSLRGTILAIWVWHCGCYVLATAEINEAILVQIKQGTTCVLGPGSEGVPHC